MEQTLNARQVVAQLVCVNVRHRALLIPPHVHKAARYPAPVLYFHKGSPTTVAKRRRMVDLAVSKMSVCLAYAMLDSAPQRYQVRVAHPCPNGPERAVLLVCVNAHHQAYTIPPHVHSVVCSLLPVLRSQIRQPLTAAKSRCRAKPSKLSSMLCIVRCIHHIL